VYFYLLLDALPTAGDVTISLPDVAESPSVASEVVAGGVRGGAP
jgi:hypothetical protein